MTERNRTPSGTEPNGDGPKAGTSLSDLKARLDRARTRDKKRSGSDDQPGGIGIAVRVGIELAGTLAVGVGIGWALDRWLGTGPWFMVVFFFLGGAGGVLNVYRAVKNLGLAAGYRAPPEVGRGAETEEESSNGGR